MRFVHTASQPSHDQAARDPQIDFTVNANGTLNLLEAARNFLLRRYLGGTWVDGRKRTEERLRDKASWTSSDRGKRWKRLCTSIAITERGVFGRD
jgi:nucleoside-diphosphate-sugar epimerase